MNIWGQCSAPCPSELPTVSHQGSRTPTACFLRAEGLIFCISDGSHTVQCSWTSMRPRLYAGVSSLLGQEALTSANCLIANEPRLLLGTQPASPEYQPPPLRTPREAPGGLPGSQGGDGSAITEATAGEGSLLYSGRGRGRQNQPRDSL